MLSTHRSMTTGTPEASRINLEAGGTSVELSSATPEYKSVWVPSNWTVVSTDRPLAAWSTATTAWCYTSRSDRRIPESVTSVPGTFFAHSKHHLCTEQ